MQFPVELRDAARIDGSGHWRFLWRIVVPLSRPTLARSRSTPSCRRGTSTSGRLLVTDTPKMQTLQTGLVPTEDSESSDPRLILAGVAASIVPTLLLVVFGQRFIVKGLTAGRSSDVPVPLIPLIPLLDIHYSIPQLEAPRSTTLTPLDHWEAMKRTILGRRSVRVAAGLLAAGLALTACSSSSSKPSSASGCPARTRWTRPPASRVDLLAQHDGQQRQGRRRAGGRTSYSAHTGKIQRHGHQRVDGLGVVARHAVPEGHFGDAGGLVQRVRAGHPGRRRGLRGRRAARGQRESGGEQSGGDADGPPAQDGSFHGLPQ